MPEQNGDKAHDATPHRRQQAREQGQVAKSQDLTSAVVLLGGVAILMFLGGALVEFLYTFAQRQFGGDAWLTADPPLVMQQWNAVMGGLSATLLPIFGLLFAVAVAANVGQTGFLFVPGRLAPDPSRVNPLKGLSRIFSLPGVMRLSFGVFKVLVIATVAFWCLYQNRFAILSLSQRSPVEIGAFLLDVLSWTAVKVAAALLILALLDYAFQKWKHEQDLRMTTQQMKEEMKNLQGDPQIMARRRQVQRQLAMNRMSNAVPDADFVVTNPTELAVAVSYKPETMIAPIVVAKGAGVMAQRIRRLALKHGIPVIERKPLAQSLYKEVDVDQPVPQQFYQAVAEILRYVYELKGIEAPDAA